jgi:hypothetical protein
MKFIERIGRYAGVALLSIALVAFITYAYFLLATSWGIVILKLTVLAAIAALLAVLGWIGYTMATAPKVQDVNESNSSKNNNKNLDGLK